MSDRDIEGVEKTIGIIGPMGAGKTTLAEKLGSKLNLPVIEEMDVPGAQEKMNQIKQEYGDSDLPDQVVADWRSFFDKAKRELDLKQPGIYNIWLDPDQLDQMDIVIGVTRTPNAETIKDRSRWLKDGETYDDHRAGMLSSIPARAHIYDGTEPITGILRDAGLIDDSQPCVVCGREHLDTNEWHVHFGNSEPIEETVCLECLVESMPPEERLGQLREESIQQEETEGGPPEGVHPPGRKNLGWKSVQGLDLLYTKDDLQSKYEEMTEGKSEPVPLQTIICPHCDQEVKRHVHDPASDDIACIQCLGITTSEFHELRENTDLTAHPEKNQPHATWQGDWPFDNDDQDKTRLSVRPWL